MSQIPSIGGSGSSRLASGQNGAINELNIDQFFGLMIAELQNQDPLNPMENSELMQQVSQIREIGATDRLTSTLDSVLLGQNVASATALIGKHVKALDAVGANVEGVVDRVTISEGSPTLHIGGKQVKLNNVGEINSAANDQ